MNKTLVISQGVRSLPGCPQDVRVPRPAAAVLFPICYMRQCGWMDSGIVPRSTVEWLGGGFGGHGRPGAGTWSEQPTQDGIPGCPVGTSKPSFCLKRSRTVLAGHTVQKIRVGNGPILHSSGQRNQEPGTRNQGPGTRNQTSISTFIKCESPRPAPEYYYSFPVFHGFLPG